MPALKEGLNPGKTGIWVIGFCILYGRYANKRMPALVRQATVVGEITP
jgi:hypothetical protein